MTLVDRIFLRSSKCVIGYGYAGLLEYLSFDRFEQLNTYRVSKQKYNDTKRHDEEQDISHHLLLTAEPIVFRCHHYHYASSHVILHPDAICYSDCS